MTSQSVRGVQKKLQKDCGSMMHGHQAQPGNPGRALQGGRTSGTVSSEIPKKDPVRKEPSSLPETGNLKSSCPAANMAQCPSGKTASGLPRDTWKPSAQHAREDSDSL